MPRRRIKTNPRHYLVERWELQPELHLGHFKAALGVLAAEQDVEGAARRDFAAENGARSSLMTAAAARKGAPQGFVRVPMQKQGVQMEEQRRAMERPLRPGDLHAVV